jgi:hypothetical protein
MATFQCREYGKKGVKAECKKFQAGFKTGCHFPFGLNTVLTF